jgi:hypothetical protein
MRGAERPAKVRWTRPFLLPLKPLSNEAAMRTFTDIADDSHDSQDITKLLNLTDNMPLAVELIAHLVSYEGCSNVLSRWETEKTSLISEGFNRRSSLDASITISITSPRMRMFPNAKELLSLLSMLPDGLSDVELLQIRLPMPDVLRSKAVLLSTTLAYLDDRKKLKVLVPIREYMQHVQPPTNLLVHPLFQHFQSIIELYWKYQGVERATSVLQLTSNLGNLHQVLMWCLKMDNPDVENSIRCIIQFNSFRRLNGHSRTSLMDHIPAVLSQYQNHRLHVEFIAEVFRSMHQSPITNPELLVSQGEDHFCNIKDPVLEGEQQY